MESIKFPEMTGTYAKSQPQYKPLHLHERELPDQGEGVKQYTAKYELSELELAQINKTKSLYSMQVGDCLHPSSVLITSPFFGVEVLYLKEPNGLFVCWVKAHNGAVHMFSSPDTSDLIDQILATFDDLTSADQLFFREKPTVFIGEQGLEGM